MSKKKQTLENLESQVEQTIKKSKKHIIKWTLIISFAVIIFFTITFFLGIKINFILSDVPQITLTPIQKSLELTHDDTEIITFDIQNNNKVCRTYCEYQLIDYSRDKNLFNDTANIDPKGIITKKLLFSGNISGSGQIVYTFQLACNNVKSVLCNTQESKSYKSSFITLNYDLTKKERQIKTTLKAELERYANELKNADLILKNSTLIKDLLKQEVNSIEVWAISKDNEKLLGDFGILADQLEDYKIIWEREDYSELFAVYTNADFIPFRDSLDAHHDIVVDTANRYNDNIQKLNLEINKIDELNPLYDYYMKINKSDTIIDHINKVQAIKTRLENKNYSSIDKLNSEINDLSAEHAQIKNSFITDLISTIEYGKSRIVRINLIIEKIEHNAINSSTDSIKDNCNLIQKAHNDITSVNKKAQDLLDTKYANLNATFNRTVAQYKQNLMIEVDNLLDNTTKPLQKINSAFGMTKNDFIKIIKLDLPQELEDYQDTYCINQSNLAVNLTPTSTPIIEYSQNVSSHILTDILPNNPKCCILGNCEDCCDDCSKDNYPIIFVHGHAFRKTSSPEESLNTFATIQIKMQDNGYVNGGQIELESKDIPYNEWGKIPAPVTVRGSFYYIRYYDVGKYTITTEKSEGIENYAIRLKEMIDLVKFRTGKDKVNLVAHSMGGLIVREYISLFGESKVDKVILIASPNKGITESINKYCVLTGSKKECTEMATNSILMKKLNTPGNAPQNIKFYNIIGTGCDMRGLDGDGIVIKQNAALAYAENIYVNGECTDLFNTNFHNKILESEETQNKLLEILSTATK